MAAETAFPGSPFRVDCQAVQLGARQGAEWATAPERQLARAWGPLSAVLEDNAGGVVWMPAHCTAKDVGCKQLSDGTQLSLIDWRSNDLVDRMAKSVAQVDRVPQAQRQLVQSLWDRVTAIAVWIGHATSLANNFPDLSTRAGHKKRHLRDCEGQQRRRASRAQPRATEHPHDPVPLACRSGGFPGCARWEALQLRISTKEQSLEEQSRKSSQSHLGKLLRPAVASSKAQEPKPGHRSKMRKPKPAACFRVSQHSSSSLHCPPCQGACQDDGGDRTKAQAWPDPAKRAMVQHPGTPDAALQDLVELCAAGLRVQWPCGESPRGKACDTASSSSDNAGAAARPDVCGAQRMPGCFTRSAGPEVVSAEEAAALKDLQELHKDGLRILWPG